MMKMKKYINLILTAVLLLSPCLPSGRAAGSTPSDTIPIPGATLLQNEINEVTIGSTDVSVSASSNCTLYVAFYSDAGRLLHTESIPAALTLGG